MDRAGQGDQKSWQENIKRLPPFKVPLAVLSNGEIHLRVVPGEGRAEITIDRLNVRAENVTNSTDIAPTLMARVLADARILETGTFQLQAQGYPFAEVPTFNLNPKINQAARRWAIRS
jgi:methenyltetrahydromethanopterin cyclohydrolase